MFYFIAAVVCLFSLPQGLAKPRTSIRRYKPVIQVTEEIDINDITFTTSSPDFDRSSSHKTITHYNNIKPEVKSNIYRIPEVSPSVYIHGSQKDSYTSAIPVDKLYATGHPIVVPSTKYTPYKVYSVKDGSGHDNFKLPYSKSKGSDKPKVVLFETPTTFSAIGTPTHGTPKQYSTPKIVPFSSQYLSTKAPTKPTNYIPSPTFSPTVLSDLNNEGPKKFPDISEIKSFGPEKKDADWEKPSKKHQHIKKGKKASESQNSSAPEEFSANSEKVEQNLSPSTLYKDSPQSESFLSEISTIHKGGSSANNLDEVADSLDLKTGERVEFQMYGMDGPQSYKFGYDTGKGHNRHFRFEERDNTGKVKGHYGYLDEDGKMRIMKYEADPVTGFHAGPVEISPDEN